MPPHDPYVKEAMSQLFGYSKSDVDCTKKIYGWRGTPYWSVNDVADVLRVEANHPDRAHCMCGELMATHNDMELGHSAVSVWDYRHNNPDWQPLNPQQETPMLNMSKAVFLLNPNVRSIGVAYDTKDLDTALKGRVKLYHFKSLDKSLKPGDKVVVPSSVTNMGMALGLVVEVDTQVNYDSHDFQMTWILGTIDEKAMDSIKAMEQEVITKVKLAEDHKRRKELRDALLDSIDPEQLAITHVGEAEVVSEDISDRPDEPGRS